MPEKEKNRIIIAPDSFKGTMSADEVCEIVADEVRRISPRFIISCIPMSDGGEGMVESYLGKLGGERCTLTVSGPMGQPVKADYAVLPDGTAVMEMASCAGLPLMKGELHPLEAGTRGVGEMLMAISARGCTRVLMGLGGSATNDCGIGMAAALGYRFYDASCVELSPSARELQRVCSVVSPEHLPEFNVTAACDVDNPLCGERGAASVFGPQKGLMPEQIPAHDAAMRHFAGVLYKDLGAAVTDIPGAGAAGGLGAGVIAFLGARLVSGSELLLDTVGMDALLEDAALVITGEGRLDGQSVAGKVPVGVSKRAMRRKVPCIAICGCIGDGAENVLEYGIDAYYAASEPGRSMEDIRTSCVDDIRALARRVLPLYL